MPTTTTLTASALLLGTILSVTGMKPAEPTRETAPSLHGATGWLNSDPLKLGNLRGKVVLIDFCTYTCINWVRTLPYILAWEEKYRASGLVVIGVHTPEFAFEYEKDNIVRSLKEMNVTYPVAMDNNYAIWNSFNNHYWPALYLIDAKGLIRFQKFGEGDYAEIELQIRKLLRDVPGNTIPAGIVDIRPEGIEAPADWNNLQSPENFLGYERTERFASPGGVINDKPLLYRKPQQVLLNEWALSGEWNMGKEHIFLRKANGVIIYRFQARDLHLIMGPGKSGDTVRYRVLIDGRAPGQSRGIDTDSCGFGAIKDHRIYQLIRQQEPIKEREFQIEFFDPHVEVFDFTFG